MKSNRVRRSVLAAVLAAVALEFMPLAALADTVASLLGNFTINQFCEVAPSAQTITVHYAVVYGQLPALRELHQADTDGDGLTTQQERDAYVGRLAPGFADELQLTVDGTRVPLQAVRWTSSLPTEQGGFSLRVDVDFTASLPPHAGAPTMHAGAHSMNFSNTNYAGRMGWHEIVVTPSSGLSVYDTNAYATSATGGLTEALQTLPESGPLDERAVHLSFLDQTSSDTASGNRLPPGATVLGPRPAAGLPVIVPGGGSAKSALDRTETAWIARRTRQLIDGISGPTLDPRLALWTLMGALLLGAVHALSPGHGKTIVGAYLIGSRGTPRHAVFLGCTVTVTHTIGVFVLGFATLYASRFIVPERLFPILSLISALLVLGMGVILLTQRGRAALRGLQPARPSLKFSPVTPASRIGRGVLLAQAQAGHAHADGTWHSHGGGAMHSHLPPGAAGEPVTWRSLLTLGISGGLVPCPSAMVLLLAAIALNKTVYGMLLVLVFSLGLAITLTLVGLAFLFARNRFGQSGSASRWALALPVLSAATITVVGAALCVAALNR